MMHCNCQSLANLIDRQLVQSCNSKKKGLSSKLCTWLSSSDHHNVNISVSTTTDECLETQQRMKSSPVIVIPDRNQTSIDGKKCFGSTVKSYLVEMGGGRLKGVWLLNGGLSVISTRLGRNVKLFNYYKHALRQHKNHVKAIIIINRCFYQQSLSISDSLVAFS